jgi:hypothetical protein
VEVVGSVVVVDVTVVVKSQVSQSTLHLVAMNAVTGLVQNAWEYDLHSNGCGSPLQASGQEPHSTGQACRRPSVVTASSP